MKGYQRIEKVAVMVDGSFFIKRYYKLFSSCPDFRKNDFEQAALIFKKLTNDHISLNRGEQLYRVFYYDCYPLKKKIHNPISKKFIDFSNSNTAKFRSGFLEQLKMQRKVALRIGTVRDNNAWLISHQKTKEILAGKTEIKDLTDQDIIYDIKQKGVDMRIGLDISALAYKRLVDRIVLVAGDSDFVPAAKVARREGIDFILDPMWNHIGEDLFEHVDGIYSTSPRHDEPVFRLENFFKEKTKKDNDNLYSFPENKDLYIRGRGV